MLMYEFLLCIKFEYITAHSQTFPKLYVSTTALLPTLYRDIQVQEVFHFSIGFSTNSYEKNPNDQKHFITP